MTTLAMPTPASMKWLRKSDDLHARLAAEIEADIERERKQRKRDYDKKRRARKGDRP